MSKVARQRFAEEVEKAGGASSVAHALGCSTSMVNSLMSGERKPGLETAYGIEQLFGINMKEWCSHVRVKTEAFKRIA